MLQGDLDVFKCLMNALHAIGIDILQALDHTAAREATSSSPRVDLAAVHRPARPSTSCVMLQRYPELSHASRHAGLAAHTDVESLTVLFCGDRGLQAQNPRTGEWRYLEARPGCAVVNVGDSLRFLTGRRLRSALHRVVPYPGTTIRDRFSCAYFLRPELDAEFADEDGHPWTSLDWHVRKYKGYREVGKAA